MDAHLESEIDDLDASMATRPVTLLFSDVVDFTGLTRRLGDVAAHRVMQGHNHMIRAEVARWGGREVERLGDGFLLAFPPPSSQVRRARRGPGSSPIVRSLSPLPWSTAT